MWRTPWLLVRACVTLAATRFVVEQRPQAIAWLQAMGVPFSQEDGQLHLTREGGHSARRIVHVTDATGAAVQKTLIDQCAARPTSRCMRTTRWWT
jgi:L-aspartate oxidase